MGGSTYIVSGMYVTLLVVPNSTSVNVNTATASVTITK